jgi:hypothetical protein
METYIIIFLTIINFIHFINQINIDTKRNRLEYTTTVPRIYRP